MSFVNKKQGSLGLGWNRSFVFCRLKCYNQRMKKIFLLIALLCSFSCLQAQRPTEESRLFIHPYREVFVNFPNQSLGTGVRLTVFLPEEKIPLSKSYPLVVFLGFSREEMEAGEHFAQTHQVIVASIGFEEWLKPEVKNSPTISKFVRQELIPYLETNYPILWGEENRTLTARGIVETESLWDILQYPHLFSKAALQTPGVDFPVSKEMAGSLRFYVRGNQAELAAAQQALEAAGFTYGPDFALRYAQPQQEGFSAIDFDYLTTSSAKSAVKRLEAFTQASQLPLQPNMTTGLRVVAWLKNGQWYDYIPETLKFSPPYLAWDATQGMIRILPGAAAGTVKIRSAVDKSPFSIKIKLKK